jgi:cation transport regulator ChaC
VAENPVFYFAYGSNADPDRFRARVGPWISRRPAWLDGYRLRFAASVQSEGGGGAVVDPAPGGAVAGVLYEITAEQLAAMDREEFDPSRDTRRLGKRVRVTVRDGDGTREAETYTVDDDGRWRSPSAAYVAFIVRGLEDVGHGNEAVRAVREAAHAPLLRKVFAAGWGCVALSAVFLYLSHPIGAGGSQENLLLWATWLMFARLFGIGSFAVGCVAIYNQRWNQGIALLLLSVVLPVISFLLHGTL